MEANQTFSIVIPHHISSPHLKGVLYSLASQTYSKSAFEVILVVDGKSDFPNEYTFPQELAQVTVLQHQDWLGTAEAKNSGAAVARNEWLIFLDDDMTLSDTWLSEMNQASISSEECVAFQSKVLSFESPAQIRSAGGVANVIGYAWDRGVGEFDKGQYDVQDKVMYPSSCAMMIKKSIFQALGGFDQDIFYMGEDYDFGLRLSQYGYHTEFVPFAKAYHKEQSEEHQENLNKKYYLERSRHIALLKNYSVFELLKYAPILLFVKSYKYFRYSFSFKNRRKHTAVVLKGFLSLFRLQSKIQASRKVIFSGRKKTIDQIFKSFKQYKYQIKRAPQVLICE